MDARPPCAVVQTMPESKGRRLKVLQASVEDFEEGAADESGEGAGGLCVADRNGGWDGHGQIESGFGD